MDTVLLAPECELPFTDQEGRHSLFSQRISYSQALKLQDPVERCHLLSFSKTHLIHPESNHSISEKCPWNNPYWIQEELEIARLQLGEKATEDRGVENRNEVEREIHHQKGPLTCNKANTQKGYVENKHPEKALFRFDQMQAEGFPPSTITFACILKACGSLGMRGKGQDIHAQIVKVDLSHNQLVVGSGLVDMYANCAMLAEAQEVFNNLRDCNVVSWSALMEGYGQQGEDEKVFALLDRMTREGVEADWVIVTIVLNTCSHGGLLDKAQQFFEALHDQFDITPTLEHYTCMVDLLGRAGHVEEAMTLIEEMNSAASLTLWHTLLGACRKWEYVKLGRWIFELAIQLDQKDAETYACMCNIYA